MRVLQVNKHYHPHVGGIEHVVANVAEGLADDHEMRVLASTTRGRGESFTRNGVDVVSTASLGTPLSVPVAPTFPAHLWRETRRADVVHHHLPNPLGVAADHLPTGSDAALVATYHSDIVRQSRALRIYRPVLHRFLERVDRILVTSPRLREHSEELEPFREKCVTVPLSVDVAKHDAVKSPGRFETEDDLILFVGRLNYYKGLDVLLDAMCDVDAQLLVVGDGERGESLRAQARALELDDTVTFTGRLSEADLLHAYEAADVFVLPSVEPSEAFGVVQLEAMAHGLPVVNTDLPTGVPWVSPDGETGLTVPPRDSQALSDALARLVEDETLRRELGERARRRVNARFTRERMLDRIEALYRELH